MPNKQEKTGNKGEWSEVYVLFRLLGDGRIYAADNNMKKIKDTYISIIKVLREEEQGNVLEYITGEEVRIVKNNEELLSLPAKDFSNIADHVLQQLLKDDISNGKGSFSIAKAENFMNKVFVYKIKAPAYAINQQFGGKADITMQIRNPQSNMIQDAGFSIKSKCGSASSLVNASEATNFVYEVKGINDEQMELINKIDTHYKVLDRLQYLKSINAELKYTGTYRKQCAQNLILLTSDMEHILAHALIYRYRDRISHCTKLADKLAEDNPLMFEYPEEIYHVRLKTFLYACFGGLNLGEKWHGTVDVNGGYIEVNKDGEVLAYHNHIQDIFKQYLLANCRFDTGSTGKHKFGTIYKENGSYYIKLNLQVRFKK